MMQPIKGAVPMQQKPPMPQLPQPAPQGGNYSPFGPQQSGGSWSGPPANPKGGSMQPMAHPPDSPEHSLEAIKTKLLTMNDLGPEIIEYLRSEIERARDVIQDQEKVDALMEIFYDIKDMQRWHSFGGDAREIRRNGRMGPWYAPNQPEVNNTSGAQ